MFASPLDLAANTTPPSAADIEGYDAREELARHMIFDAAPTEWAADVLGIPDIEWDMDDGRLVSDCYDYELTEDPVYGFNSLTFQGDMLAEDLGVRNLKLQARVHRYQLSRLAA